MVTPDEVRTLARLGHEEGIVSAYLAVRPRLMIEPLHPLAAFKGAVARYAQQSPDPAWQRALDRERPRIQRWLEGRRPSGRGVVFFACKPMGLWEARTLSFAVPTLLVVDTAPYTALLSQMSDEGEALAVVHVQTDRARIWVSEPSERAEAPARFGRPVDVHPADHRARVIEELLRLNAARPFRHLALGGSEPALSELLRDLPAPLPSRVAGTFPVDARQDGDEAILARAQQAIHEAGRAEERRLVQEMLDASASGGPGVIGLERTLSALLEGRVRTLLVAAGARQEGGICRRCEYLAAKRFAACPVCGAPADVTADVVGAAMERALLSGAHVESLCGEARDELLRRGHPVAAILRY